MSDANLSLLSRSSWIWPEGNFYLNNCYAQFRYDFELEEVPEKAPFLISADEFYRLYVNGRYICRGPARGYQESWPYDEVDLSAVLRKGHNWISVEAYNPGLGTFQYCFHDLAGMICAADWNGVTIRSCKKDWKMRRSPANNPNVARLSTQMAYQEDYNAGADDLSWIESPVPPDWTEAAMFRWMGEEPFGKAPYYSMEERGIPMLRETLSAPEAIVSYGSGTMRSGFESAFNLAWFWEDGERQTVADWHTNGTPYPVQRSEDSLSFSVAPQKEGTFLALTIRLDRIRIGTFGLEIDNGTGCEIADALFYQYLPDEQPVDLPPIGYGGMVAPAVRLRAARGKSRRMFFPVLGMHYIVLVLRNVRTELKIRTSFRNAEYPFRMRGLFETSDRELNAIHALCRTTQQICAEDAYLDTPWREQGQWWGDARIQGRNTFFLDGDTRLLKRGIRSIAGQKTPSGLTMGVAPCCRETCILPDFSLTWLLTIFDYFWQTGDLSLFHEQLPRMEQVLAYFSTPEARAENGLLQYDPRFWLFEDWAPLPKRGCPCFLNLLYLYTLSHLIRLFRAGGLEKRAGELEEERRILQQKILAAFYDRESGLFRAGLEEDGTAVPEPPSLHDQVLAILNALVPEAYPAMIRQRLRPFLLDEPCDFAVPTSFWCNYLFEAAKHVGLERETLDFIRRHWSRMLPSGGTWEHLNWNRYDGQSCCHAWSAHPAYHLPELLGGITQLEPGWTRFRCVPNPDLLPESGRILLPLPPGDFILQWDRESGISMTVPPGCIVEGAETDARNERR